METTTTTPSYSEMSEQLEGLKDRSRPGRTFDLLARMLDLKDSDLQELTGFSRQTINKLRNGRLVVQMSHLWPLASAVGLDMDDLLLSPLDAAAKLLNKNPAQFRCTEWA